MLLIPVRVFPHYLTTISGQDATVVFQKKEPWGFGAFRIIGDLGAVGLQVLTPSLVDEKDADGWSLWEVDKDFAAAVLEILKKHGVDPFVMWPLVFPKPKLRVRVFRALRRVPGKTRSWLGSLDSGVAVVLFIATFGLFALAAFSLLSRFLPETVSIFAGVVFLFSVGIGGGIAILFVFLYALLAGGFS